jgi:hypothetical protein
VLSDDVNWRERGNRVVEGFLVEYFANPAQQIRKYMENEFRSGSRGTARAFVVGRVLFDKTGIVKELQEQAQRQMEAPLPAPDQFWLEYSKYALWEGLDSLKDIAEQKSPPFTYLYFLHLNRVVQSYTRFLGTEIPPPARLYRCLAEEDFREKYCIPEFPDAKFAAQFQKCLEEPSLEGITELTEHVLGKMGGFEIDGWTLTTPPTTS